MITTARYFGSRRKSNRRTPTRRGLAYCAGLWPEEQKLFEAQYGAHTQVDLTTDPSLFIEKARAGQYDALLVRENRGSKMAEALLTATKDLSPIRVVLGIPWYTKPGMLGMGQPLHQLKEYGATAKIHLWESDENIRKALQLDPAGTK